MNLIIVLKYMLRRSKVANCSNISVNTGCIEYSNVQLNVSMSKILLSVYL